MSRLCLKCLPKYVNYDWIYVYIERGDLKKNIDRLLDVKMDFTPNSM